MSLEQQAELRKSRLESIRNRKRQQQETDDTKPKRQIVSRNIDPETKLPVDAFSSKTLQSEFDLEDSLRLQLESGEIIEALPEDEEKELIHTLTAKFNQEDLERPAKIKSTVTSEFKKDLQLIQAQLDAKTDRAIRKYVRDRLQKENQDKAG